MSGKKTDVKSGIFFKHRQLTNVNQLQELDKHLNEAVDHYITSGRIKWKKEPPVGFYEKISKKIRITIHSRRALLRDVCVSCHQLI